MTLRLPVDEVLFDELRTDFLPKAQHSGFRGFQYILAEHGRVAGILWYEQPEDLDGITRPGPKCQDVRGSPPGRWRGRGRGANPRPRRGHGSLPTSSHRPDIRARATGHRGRFSFARCTIAWARRTYLLSASSRTLLTPSACAKASAAPLDRPRAVTGASARPANLSTSDWSCGGGWVSGCSTIHASRCWLR